MALADLYEHLTGVVDHQPWRDRAACKGLDASLWFPKRGDWSGGVHAKAVCRGCEVRAECLEHAMAQHETFGIWGATSERERKVMRRTRPPPEPEHGTVACYNDGCRCEPCCTTYADYRRRGRLRASGVMV